MLIVNKVSKILGQITVPGDKSISHRAIMLGAISTGKSVIKGFLNGQDCLRTIECFRDMGICIRQEGDKVEVQGKGLYGLREPDDVLDAGNSGTTMRLMSGILAGQKFLSVITGDQSLRNRPMSRIAMPLRQMGACIDGRNQGEYAPLVIRGGNLHGLTWQSAVASAQLKSAILLAGLYANEVTTVQEPVLSRDHTERMLVGFGIDISRNETEISIKPGILEGQKVDVPGDISSAAFFMVAAAALPGSNLVIKNVGLNPTRTGIIDVLSQMGAQIEIDNVRITGGEEAGDIIVRGAKLQGIEIGHKIIPRLIDEIPIIAVAAALAQGTTLITGAGELKVKESNRLAAIASELSKMRVQVEELSDGLKIVGPNSINGATVNSYNDHRIAMAMAVCGLFAEGETTIIDSDCIDISFPGFTELLREVTR